MDKAILQDILSVYDAATSGATREYIITDKVMIADDAMLWMYESVDGDIMASAVSYDDGTVFVLSDWQAPSRPEHQDDLQDYDWVRIDGKPAIVLSGLPRCLC